MRHGKDSTLAKNKVLSPLGKGIGPGHALDTLQAVDHTRRIQTSNFWVVHRDYDHLREQYVLALLNW